MKSITHGSVYRAVTALIFTIKTLNTEWAQAKATQSIPLSIIAVAYALAVGVVVLTFLEMATRYIRKNMDL